MFWLPNGFRQKDTVRLYELSSTLYDVLQEWLGNEIMESLGDQTWYYMKKQPSLVKKEEEKR